MLYFQQFQDLWQEIPEEFGFTAGPLEDDCKFLLFVSSKSHRLSSGPLVF
jgi:hypothetical protein